MLYFGVVRPDPGASQENETTTQMEEKQCHLMEVATAIKNGEIT